MKRLSNAYLKAERISFDDSSRLVFFSDVHRGDNSLSDEYAHNQNTYLHALKHYYDGGFTYIEVGDGDELWEHSKFEHIVYAHRDTYLRLKNFYDEGRFIMLYGNHNMSLKSKHYVDNNLQYYYNELSDEKSELFKGITVHEAVVLVHRVHQGEIFVVHGHQGDLMNDQIWRLMKAVNRYFWHYLHIIGFRNPASPAKNAHKRHKIEINYSKWIKQNQKMLIMGHTHRAKFPTEKDVPYFNTGSCVYPRNITCIEIEEGMISLVDWRVKSNDDGHLFVRRNVISGPKPVSDYMFLQR